MRSQAGKRVKVIRREVAIAHRIEAVGGNTRKAQFFRQRWPIHGESTAAQRARSQWAGIRHAPSGAEPFQIAKKCLGMREDEMRKENRLRTLKVRHSGQWDSHRSLGQACKRSDESNNASREVLRGVLDEHAEVGGHQLVAA